MCVHVVRWFGVERERETGETYYVVAESSGGGSLLLLLLLLGRERTTIRESRKRT